jgi:chromosome segregation ATPase
MKLFISFYTGLMLAILFSCGHSALSEINDLHKKSRQAGDDAAVQLESLTQKANSINILGRALTPEEMDFTGKVASLQETYTQWNKDMEKAESMKPGKERFDLEKKLNEAIGVFARQLEALTPPGPGF